MFEKYDGGVPAFWNPRRGTFYSEDGKRLAVIKEIVETMPTDLFLDGELWYISFSPPPPRLFIS